MQALAGRPKRDAAIALMVKLVQNAAHEQHRILAEPQLLFVGQGHLPRQVRERLLSTLCRRVASYTWKRLTDLSSKFAAQVTLA